MEDFPEMGASTLQGAPTYDFAKFFLKLQTRYCTLMISIYSITQSNFYRKVTQSFHKRCAVQAGINWYVWDQDLHEHRWFSGRMLACHAGGPGSIPGRCNLRFLLIVFFSHGFSIVLFFITWFRKNLIWLLSLCVLSAKSVQFRRISRSISSYMLKFHRTDARNFKLFVFSSINKSNFMKYSGNTSQNTQSTVWKRKFSNPRRDSNPQSPA